MARRLADQWDRQRGHLFPWTPVCLGLGIGIYFALLREPSPWLLSAVAGLGLALAGAGIAAPRWRAGLWAVALVATGLVLAAVQAHRVAAPVLSHRYYGPVQGRLIAVDRSASDAARLTLDRVVLARRAPSDTPGRVRVAVHGEGPHTSFEPGKTLILTAHLSPPPGPAEPGGFDFRRHAWFQGIGAVGYGRDPVLALAPAAGLPVQRARAALTARLHDAMPGPEGAFAAAIITGDRTRLRRGQTEALRDSNLSHLLAISGLHMGLLSSGVFFLLRLLLAWPASIRGWNARAIAAAGALVAAAGYLAMSGANVATQRAFLMVAVALGAVFLDRRVLSLRGVAVAATLILVLKPQALLDPGFQMSFAATTALVWVFTGLRGTRLAPRGRVLRAVLGTALSSAVAGAATAPIAMAHFNQVSQFGLLANLAAVPVMGLLVMPGAALGVLLMPVGGEAAGLALMRLGLRWILWVAETVAGMEGAVRPVPTPPVETLWLIALGAVFVVLWQGRGRWFGTLPIACAAALWAGHTRPEVLVAQGGALVGQMTERGRALSRDRGAGFIARVWLENDGQGLDQTQAGALWPEDGRIRHLRGKRAAAAFDGCAGDALIVSDKVLGKSYDCRVLDADALRAGPVVARWTGRAWDIRSGADARRPWSPAQ